MRAREPLVVWLLFAVVALEIVVTYSRLPASELYHVTGSGVLGGLSRVLVFLNFPVALAAIATLAVCYERLPGRGWRVFAVVAALLSALVFWPGVVSQADLDARWVNVPAAVGVALAAAVTLSAQAVAVPAVVGDRVRLALATLALLAAPAWLAAELGFFLDGVPLLGRLYLSGEYMKQRAGLPPFPPAVHHGHHHGLDGVLLVTASLLLSRLLPTIRGRGLRQATAAYLALMLAYGFGNVANDFWLEQVVRRRWTSWSVPSVLSPQLTWAWGLVVAAAIVIWLVWFRGESGGLVVLGRPSAPPPPAVGGWRRGPGRR